MPRGQPGQGGERGHPHEWKLRELVQYFPKCAEADAAACTTWPVAPPLDLDQRRHGVLVEEQVVQGPAAAALLLRGHAHLPPDQQPPPRRGPRRRRPRAAADVHPPGRRRFAHGPGRRLPLHHRLGRRHPDPAHRPLRRQRRRGLRRPRLRRRRDVHRAGDRHGQGRRERRRRHPGPRPGPAVGGTPVPDQVLFRPGAAAGTVEVILNGVSQGTFAPTGRLLAFGGAGDDVLRVSSQLAPPACLDGGAATTCCWAGRGTTC
jgi:hypothetical protein